MGRYTIGRTWVEVERGGDKSEPSAKCWKGVEEVGMEWDKLEPSKENWSGIVRGMLERQVVIPTNSNHHMHGAYQNIVGYVATGLFCIYFYANDVLRITKGQGDEIQIYAHQLVPIDFTVNSSILSTISAYFTLSPITLIMNNVNTSHFHKE